MGSSPVEIRGVATAAPHFEVDAEQTKYHLTSRLDPARADAYARMIDATRVRRRHLVMPPDDLFRLAGIQSRNDHYIAHALAIGEDVVRRGIAEAAVTPEALDTIVSASCTGYMLPSLEARLIDRLALRREARRVPITELGCSAGVAALGLAASLMPGQSDSLSLVLSVEIASLGLQIAEPSTADMLANLIFGDGASAAVLASRPSGRGPLILGSRSVLWGETLEALGMRLTDFGFRLFLSPFLPTVVQTRLPETISGFLASHSVRRDDIRFWICHQGGPKILDAVASSLDLRDREIQASWDVWEQHGNLSSASVFFVMKRMAEIAPPAPGDLGVMLAFGPGVSCEMVLLQSQGWLSGVAPAS
ncbi:MAG TPA: 3-oxoacyl-[acyl-carrier-protein] synthase III C-terminal domain-containing protein [Candidatus Binatia bacterium]|jgi:alkylresorcinol/alkylpyrone synthase